jgi:hypothetical protein
MKTKRLVQSVIFEGKKLSLGTVCRCQKKKTLAKSNFFAKTISEQFGAKNNFVKFH